MEDDYIRFRIDPMLKFLFRKSAIENHAHIAENQIMSTTLRKMILDYVVRTISSRDYAYTYELHILHEFIGDFAVYITKEIYSPWPDRHMIGVVRSTKMEDDVMDIEEHDEDFTLDDVYKICPFTINIDFYIFKEYNTDIAHPKYFKDDSKGDFTPAIWFEKSCNEFGYPDRCGAFKLSLFEGGSKLDMKIMSLYEAEEFIKSEEGTALRESLVKKKEKYLADVSKNNASENSYILPPSELLDLLYNSETFGDYTKVKLSKYAIKGLVADGMLKKEDGDLLLDKLNNEEDKSPVLLEIISKMDGEVNISDILQD